jgi:hypothetical protein
LTGWNKANPLFSRGLSTAERAVFIGALWRAEKRVEQIFRRSRSSRQQRVNTPTGWILRGS